MKRLVIFITLMMLSVNILANTREDAEALYADRGSDVENSMKAALIYEALAAEATDVMDKAELLYKESEARYFYGTNKDGYWPMEIKGVAEVPEELKEERIAIHKTAYKKLTAIMNELRALPETDVRNQRLAEVIFFYGANLGKWGENNGAFASAKKWPELKKAMKEIKKLGQKKLEAFGADRVLGRGIHKLAEAHVPFTSFKKALKRIQPAYKNSLNADGTASIHGLNNLFYAETLIKLKKKDEAKVVLENFISVDPLTLHAGRVPETVVEIEFAKKLLGTL